MAASPVPLWDNDRAMAQMSNNLISIRKYRAEATLHRHDHHQIVLPRVGNLELEVAGRGGRVEQGVGAFIVAGATHAFRAKGSNGFLVIDLPDRHFDSEQLAWSFDKSAFFPIEPRVQGLLDYASATLERNKPSGTILAYWMMLLMDGIAQGRPVIPSSEILALNRATVFMRIHASKPIRVTDVCGAAGLSVTRLYALFRKHYGQSPHAALLQFRVEAARQLLVRTNLSIAEVAVRTGHGDQSALTRRLRRALGVTPAALRRAARAVSHVTEPVVGPLSVFE
jgi:AraC-like DNA-binding protein